MQNQWGKEGEIAILPGVRDEGEKAILGEGGLMIVPGQR